MSPSARRRWISRIAVLAVLLNALVPTLSQALAWARVQGGPAAGWVEICTSQGPRWERLSDADPAAPAGQEGQPAPGAAHAACLYCLPHAGSVGLPGSIVVPSVPAQDCPIALPVWAAPRLSPPPPWVAPAVRAPPSLPV